MTSQRCFRDLIFSGGNNSLKVWYRLKHGTPNFSIRSACGDLTMIIFYRFFGYPIKFMIGNEEMVDIYDI